MNSWAMNYFGKDTVYMPALIAKGDIKPIVATSRFFGAALAYNVIKPFTPVRRTLWFNHNIFSSKIGLKHYDSA